MYISDINPEVTSTEIKEPAVQRPVPEKNTVSQPRTLASVYTLHVFPGLIHLIDLYVKGSIKINRTINRDREFNSFRSQKNDILKYKETGPRVFIEEIGLKQELNKKFYSDIINSSEYILGEFDQDGYVLPNLVPIHAIPIIDKEHFLPRKKFRIFLVSVYGCLGVKKDYMGDKNSFVDELKIYSRLLGKNINIPAILDVNYDLLSITYSYIRGPTIRESLHRIGAVLFDRDVEANPDLYKISDQNRWLIQTEDKSGTLYSVIDSEFIENLFHEVKKIHDCDIYISDVKYGNLIIEALSHEPYLIDFESSRDLSSFGKYVKKIQKDQEIKLFHDLFFTQKTDINFEKQE